MKTSDFNRLCGSLLALILAFTSSYAQTPATVSAQALSARKQKGSGFPDFRISDSW